LAVVSPVAGAAARMEDGTTLHQRRGGVNDLAGVGGAMSITLMLVARGGAILVTTAIPAAGQVCHHCRTKDSETLC
jgi:hypothetical protein